MILRILFAAAVLTIGLDQFRPLMGGVGNLSDILFQVVFIVGATLWFARLDLERLKSGLLSIRWVEPLLWGGVLLTLGAGIASLGSSAPVQSWKLTFRYFVTFCVWLPWVALATERYLSAAQGYALYVGGFCLIAAATLSDLFLGSRFGADLVSTPIVSQNLDDLTVGLRYGGPTGHPNTLGYIAAMCFLACLGPGINGNWHRAWASSIGLIVSGGALLVSGSRAAILGVAVGSVVLLTLSGRGERKRLLWTMFVGVCAIAVVSTVTGLGSETDPVRRLVESVRPRRSFEADWQRHHDLQLTRRLLQHDPLTGYGMEDIGTSAPATKTGGFKLPHSVPLQSWVAGGALALLGTLWLYGVVLWFGRIAVRGRHTATLGLWAACVAFVVMDAFHPAMNQRFKWFAVALLMASLRKARSETAGDTPAA